MKRILLIAGLAAYLGLSAAALADESVLRRDPKTGKETPVIGTIEDETPAGVKIKVGKDSQLIPPEDILHVAYTVPDVSEIEFSTPYGKEQQALGLTGDDRKKGMAEALTLYKALQKKTKPAPKADRYVQFRIAMLAAAQAKDDPSLRPAAIEALKAYRSANSGGWEIVPATKTVAGLLEEGGDQAGARQAYEELAANPDVPKPLQLNMNLLTAKMLLREKKYPDAEQKLKAVLAGVTDEKQKAYVQVYLAQTQVAQGNAKDAETPLKAAIKAAGDDDNLKALAYNALGDCQQANKQPDEAFWQYLRVDVLYNQDREEHARALYNLWKLYDTVRSDPQRRAECLAQLKAPSLAGTEYQARALQEAPAENKTP